MSVFLRVREFVFPNVQARDPLPRPDGVIALQTLEPEIMSLMFNQHPRAVQWCEENGAYHSPISYARPIEYNEDGSVIWDTLLANPSSEAMEYLESHWDEADTFCNNVDEFRNEPLFEIDYETYVRHNIRHFWTMLSTNPAAIHILQRHPRCVDLEALWSNPAVFEDTAIPESSPEGVTLVAVV